MRDLVVCVQRGASTAPSGFLGAAAVLSRKRATLLVLTLLLSAKPHSAKDERSPETIISAVADAVISGPVPRAPYTLAACAVFWNEKPYLFEWVVYHYLLGVQHFYLYDNDSTDEPLSALQPLIDRGIVTYIPWPGLKSAAQSKELKDCFSTTRAEETHWMAGIDIDEFIVVVSQELTDSALLNRDSFVLHDLLRGFQKERKGAVIMDRANFNCNGHREPTGGLVIRDYTHRTVSLRPMSVVGKPLVLLRALDRMQGAHQVALKAPWAVVTADRAPWSNATKHHTFEPFRINHYLSRSYAECLAKSTSSRRPPRNWRLMHGAKLCDKAMIGTPLFSREENAPDVFLAASWLPLVIDAVVLRTHSTK